MGAESISNDDSDFMIVLRNPIDGLHNPMPSVLFTSTANANVSSFKSVPAGSSISLMAKDEPVGDGKVAVLWQHTGAALSELINNCSAVAVDFLPPSNDAFRSS